MLLVPKTHRIDDIFLKILPMFSIFVISVSFDARELKADLKWDFPPIISTPQALFQSS